MAGLANIHIPNLSFFANSISAGLSNSLMPKGNREKDQWSKNAAISLFIKVVTVLDAFHHSFIGFHFEAI